jgi:hypothetical protein
LFFKSPAAEKQGNRVNEEKYVFIGGYAMIGLINFIHVEVVP